MCYYSPFDLSINNSIMEKSVHFILYIEDIDTTKSANTTFIVLQSRHILLFSL